MQDLTVENVSLVTEQRNVSDDSAGASFLPRHYFLLLSEVFENYNGLGFDERYKSDRPFLKSIASIGRSAVALWQQSAASRLLASHIPKFLAKAPLSPRLPT